MGPDPGGCIASRRSVRPAQRRQEPALRATVTIRTHVARPAGRTSVSGQTGDAPFSQTVKIWAHLPRTNLIAITRVPCMPTPMDIARPTRSWSIALGRALSLIAAA